MSHRTLFSVCHHLLKNLSVFGSTSWISVTFRREGCNAVITKQNFGQRNLSVTINVLHDNGKVWGVFLCVTWCMDCETRIFLWRVKKKPFWTAETRNDEFCDTLICSRSERKCVLPVDILRKTRWHTVKHFETLQMLSCPEVLFPPHQFDWKPSRNWNR